MLKGVYILLLLPDGALKSGGPQQDDSLNERKPNNTQTLFGGLLRVEVSAYDSLKREETLTTLTLKQLVRLAIETTYEGAA